MALFINVDPVPARWYWRRVFKGWQFGYSGGTQNDFVIDVEVARWRLVCYIGFKKVENWAPGYERHLKWRKEQEFARERANKPESSLRRFWRSLRGIKTPSNRMDQKRAEDDKALADPGLLLDSIDELRQCIAQIDSNNERRRILATRPSVPEPIYRASVAPIQGKLLREEHQRPAPEDDHPKDPESGRLSEEQNA